MSMSIDKVPGDLQLYIGGLFTVRRRDLLEQCGITHILSVLGLPLDKKLFDGFQHKVVEVDDTEDENLLEHFPACIQFIQSALDTGKGILVHCAMGKSRSATVVCAYLMKHFDYTPQEALALLRQSRPFCDPNDGFRSQLGVYHDTNMSDDLENSTIYQRWMYKREIQASRTVRQAPEADKIYFEDEHQPESTSIGLEMKCKKCRRTLATSQYLVEHQPSSGADSSTCAHYFLDPLSWMRPELEQGKLEGRLECPKCSTNVGKYAWQGMQCSCGEWIVPGISLAKGRIDESKPKGTTFGIRQPPQSKRSGIGQENL